MNNKIRFLALTAAMAGFLFGFDTAVISGTIELVTLKFGLSDAGVGWFVSSALLGAISGVVFSGYFSDRYGRKPMLIVSGVLFLISSLGCSFSGSFTELILYRFLGGIAFGMASMVAPLYISEMSPARERGKLVSVYQLAITVGILLAYFGNYWASQWSLQSDMFSYGPLRYLYHDEVWRGMFANEIVPISIYLFCLIFIPKSPRWLMVRNQKKKAEKIAGAYGIDIFTLDSTNSKEKIPFGKLIRSVYKRPMMIAIFLMVFSQICGINAIIYYGPSIMAKAGFTLNEALGGQVTIGIVNSLFTLIAIFTIDKWGRIPLLKFGAGGVILSLITISFLFFLGGNATNFVILGIVVYIACYAFSLGPVQFVVAAEIFPTEIRGRALTISTLFLWSTNALVGQVFPLMLNGLGAAGTFMIFAIICLPSLWFIKRFIPETKGRSLEEIQLYWQK